MAESKETIIGIIEQINDATEPGSVTNRMVAAVLNYLADNLITGETMDDIASLKERVGTLENRVDGLGIAEINTAISNLRTQLQNEATSRGDADAAIITRLQALENALSTLMEGDVTSAIESFNEVISFLQGVTDDETLTGLLTTINSRLSALEANGSVTTQKIAAGAVTGEKIANEAVGTEHLEDDAVTSSKIEAGAIDPVHLSSSAKKLIEDADNVIMISIWTNEQPGVVKDTISKAGVYVWNYVQKKLYVSVLQEDIILQEVTPSEENVYIDRKNNIPYVWKEGNMVAIAPKNVPASIFNATIEKPIQGYYVLFDPLNTDMSAVHAAWSAEKAVSGLILSFELSAGIWKTYQYVGKTVTEQNWLNTENWKDFGSLAAGSETYIIINGLIGAPTVGSYYTLETAVARLIDYEASSGVTYRKTGLIISYITGENVMETKQFQGNIADFGTTDLWKDFGGGSNVETSDEPEEGGTKALSTGGAYAHIPAAIGVNTDTEGVVKLQLKNAGGEGVGDEIQFNVGTGSGGGSGTTIAMAYQDNPIYGRAGGSFVVRAAIMSVTKAGSTETTNSIMSVNFVNRTTKKVVAVFQPKKPSSASMSDYSFEFDLSSLCVSAGEQALQAVVTDDGGNTATKNISIIAVDVTCVSAQTLNYTRDTVLEVSGSAKNIPMYKFPNNASDKGIRVKVELYSGGEWRQIANTIITDTYSHNVLINPAGLSHGAYPIRIQGEDVSSGVKGNVLHTAVMVIQQDETIADYNLPIVVARWSDDTGGTKKLYESVTVDVAVFQRENSNPVVDVELDNDTFPWQKYISEQVMARNMTYTVGARLTTNCREGDVMKLLAKCGNVVQPEEYGFTIVGSLLPIHETEGAHFKIELASRSNDDTDKSIAAECSDGSVVSLDVVGSNYSSNGFVKDSYGTPDYGTAQDKGRMSLRVAEDVYVNSNIKPYANSAIEINGSAFSFTTQVRNVADRNSVLMECRGDKMGFVMTGEKLVVFTNGDIDDAGTTCTIPYAVDMVHRFDIVVEPNTLAPYGGIGVIKVYKDGDEAGAVKYTAGAFPTTDATVNWYGEDADVYLYEVCMWNTYYGFMQAFNNYLLGKTDTDEMLEEYEKNDVMASQTAEGKTKDRPSMQKCLDAGIMVVVLTKSANTEDIAKNYPDYLEGLDGDKKTTIPLDWYCYFPGREWQNCIITEDPTSNQGTTSSWRKIKNKKAKHKKAKKMRLMFTREEIAEMYPGRADILAKYDKAAEMAAKFKLQIVEGGQFTNINTIKVDYSDSCGAHNGAMMDLMNDTQIALGADYMTPAQVFNEGEYEIHTSIDSIPCALFRTDHNMTALEAIDPANAYFHAKANFNADKGDAAFFGFEKVKGYNAGCLNYGDFVEIVAAKNQTMQNFKAAVLADTSSLVAGKIYVLSEYCGPEHVVLENDGTGSMHEVGAVDSPTEIEKTLAEVLAMDVSELAWDVVYLTLDGRYVQYQGGVWQDTTGTMTFDAASRKWSVTGRVVNPVENYEELKYDYLCWMQGVNSVEDMMVIDSSTGFPIWMSYFESRYPDDDDLNDKYERGLKVPYNLYRWLMFCQQCNHNLTAADGNITLDGASVAGTPANRLQKWCHELHKQANVKSCCNYTVASDYKAAVDQRSKNAMLGFYLDTDGRVKLYMNHWYDGDCVDGSDNDCGLTIPWDMDARTSHLYQGWDNVLFKQIYAAGEIWLNDSGSETITLSAVAAAMRKVERNNIRVFSADGCYYYWVTKRLAKWAKVISSYDGERKYIENSTPADNYFYALHGLRLDDLPDYQRKRFKYCDGQYQVGDLYTNPFKARMMGNIEITITAAQDGFFGLGEDRADVCADSCHLLAGESYTMRANAAQESGKMIYIFGADKLAKLDISHCSPKLEAFSLEYCTLLEDLIIGGEDYVPEYTTGILSSLELPAMPFLKKVDIRNTKIATMTARNCPRLKTLLAAGSRLQSVTMAESAPIETLELPATISDLRLKNIKGLTYPGGMTFEGMSNLRRLVVDNCPLIDKAALMEAATAANAVITKIRLTGLDILTNSSVLQALVDAGATGIDANGVAYDETGQCSGLVGIWALRNLVDDTTMQTFKTYFRHPSPLTLYNNQMTMIQIDDTLEYDGNITNLENNTVDGVGDGYIPSGHINMIKSRLHVYKGKFNSTTKKMEVNQVDDADLWKLQNGEALDLTDTNGEGYDLFVGIPHYWYKGINNHQTNKKYIAFSSVENVPRSSASAVIRDTLDNLLAFSNKAVQLSNMTVGEPFDRENLVMNGSNSVYRISVAGMKQVRWPGVNSNTIGGVFLDADNHILSTAYTFIAHAQTDFVPGEYVFINVPEGAAAFVFTAPNGFDDLEAIAVDSEQLEAIEPDWVEHKFELVGVYKGYVDGQVRLRSISGVTPRTGTGTAATSNWWQYDANGDLTVGAPASITELNLTGKDWQNLAKCRGKGYQIVDYETHKDIANLWMAIHGRRNSQSVNGAGVNGPSTTGGTNNTLEPSPLRETTTGRPRTMGLEDWWGNIFEWIDGAVINVPSWKAYYKNHGEAPAGSTVNGIWHIHMPDGTERKVQGLNNATIYINIARMRHGRYCDVIPSKAYVNNAYNTFYCDGWVYQARTGRCLLRSGNNTSASFGIVYCNADYDSAYSGTDTGARLAFKGDIEVVD